MPPVVLANLPLLAAVASLTGQNVEVTIHRKKPGQKQQWRYFEKIAAHAQKEEESRSFAYIFSYGLR
jgi:hypothetical protein